MSTESLEYLEKVLSGLKQRYASGDKSVEAKLRAVSLKVDQLKLKKDLISATAKKKKKSIAARMATAVRRRGCCR